MNSRDARTSQDGASAWGQTTRSVASLLLFIHLFCIAVALAANHSPSRLQDRLLTVFRPYTRLLNFDITFVRYDLTQAAPDDAEPRIEYLPAGKAADQDTNWELLGSGPRGGERWARYQRLAWLMAFYGSREENAPAARLSQSIAEHLAGPADTPIAQLRSRRHLLQAVEDVDGTNAARRNPNDASYFVEVYRAETIVDPDSKQVLVQKVEERGQVAPPRGASARPASNPATNSNDSREGTKPEESK